MAFNMLTGFGLLFGGLITWGGWYEWQKLKAIRQTPRSTVRSIAMGNVELHGTITADEPLSSPLTGTKCVCYEYEVEEHKHDDDGSDWHTVERGRKQARAELTDDTGTVSVDLTDVSIEDGTQWQTKTDNPGDELEQRLEQLDVTYEGWLGDKYMRYTETRIDDGDEVYLLGTARDNPDVEDGTSTENEDDILIQAADDFFLIANSDESGLRNQKYWKLILLFGIGIPILIASIVGIIAL